MVAGIIVSPTNNAVLMAVVVMSITLPSYQHIQPEDSFAAVLVAPDTKVTTQVCIYSSGESVGIE